MSADCGGIIMGQYVDYYCKNNCRELKKLVEKILTVKFSWILKSMYDDFYSIAGEHVWKCEIDYNESKGAKFETYLVMCLERKFKTYITYINRKKRSCGAPEISLESLVNENGNTTLKDLITEKNDNEIGKQTQIYLDSLSKIQYKIAEMIMEGYNFDAIKKELNLTNKRFSIIYNRMKSMQKTNVLHL